MRTAIGALVILAIAGCGGGSADLASPTALAGTRTTETPQLDLRVDGNARLVLHNVCLTHPDSEGATQGAPCQARPLVDAPVVLSDSSGRQVAATTADEFGDFEMLAPKPGSYMVSLPLPGHPGLSQQVQVPLPQEQSVQFLVRK